jgi:hypothetical protein
MLMSQIYLSWILRIAFGAYAIQAPGAPLGFERAVRYGVAASFHGERTGVDPFELVAIARNESDFVEDTRGPDGKDCGLTQTRITITKFSCKQLRRSYWLAFQEAAREMKEYGAACRGKSDYDRCRLNHYNSGAHYAKRGVHGAYWLRVQCFAQAARASVPGATCRKVHSRGEIAQLIRRAQKQQRAKVIAVAEQRPNS